MSGQTRAVIVIRRGPEGWRDKFRGFRILIDGQRAGSIRRGATREIPVEPGRHTVQLRIDWCSSPEIDVEVGDGGQAVLLCRPGGAAGEALPAITLGRNEYIHLERA